MMYSPVFPPKSSNKQNTQFAPAESPMLAALKEKTMQTEKKALADKRENIASINSLLVRMAELKRNMENERLSKQAAVEKLERIIATESIMAVQSNDTVNPIEGQVLDKNTLPLENLFDLPIFEDVISEESEKPHRPTRAHLELQKKLDDIEHEMLACKKTLNASTKAIVEVMKELLKKLKSECHASQTLEEHMNDILAYECEQNATNTDLGVGSVPLLLGRKRDYSQSDLNLDVSERSNIKRHEGPNKRY